MRRYSKFFRGKPFRFDLYSGERQTGKDIKEIRADHLNRYELVIKRASCFFTAPSNLLGLDIFSGVGYGTFLLNQKLGCAMIGIEGSGGAVNFAKRYYHSPSILYVQKQFPFHLSKETFDFITSVESIEHVEGHEFLFKNIASALKENGYLFLSAPNENIIPLRIYKDDFNYHYKHFTGEEIKRYSGINGLMFVSLFGQNLYKLGNGKILQILPAQDMELEEGKEGQINMYILKKLRRPDR